MASVYHSTTEVAFVSGNKVTVFVIGSGDSHVIKSDTIDKKGEDKKSDDSGSDRILACGYSTIGQYFALCDDHKVITLWNTGQNWTKLSSRQLMRRCTSLRFTHSDDAILVADKSGDAYSFSTTSPGEDGQLLLGHVSMLLDLGWFFEARSRNIPKSGVMIQEKAILLSMNSGYNDFTGLNGWLDWWKAQHNVRCSVLNGESADVPEEAVRNWGQRLPVFCNGYEANDIFNADETGMFFRAMLTKSMVIPATVGRMRKTESQCCWQRARPARN
ncbi:hypothetical protein LSAT2_003612 [Lamellibrachia satsuma]|nr:hypothetical protein LSAT2_003612 [Lamellibrachia satsuma]